MNEHTRPNSRSEEEEMLARALAESLQEAENARRTRVAEVEARRHRQAEEWSRQQQPSHIAAEMADLQVKDLHGDTLVRKHLSADMAFRITDMRLPVKRA